MFRALAHDDRGVAMALVAVSAVVLLGMTGLGVETGLWYTIKRYNQSAADFAAISGAMELAAGKGYLISGPPPQGICGLAQRDAARNGFTFAAGWACPASSPNAQSSCTNLASGDACIDNPPLFGFDAGDSLAVEVILAQQQNTFFGKLFLPNVKIDVRAVAKINEVGITCSLALGTTQVDVQVQGSASIDLNDCGIATNSNNACSIKFGGGNNDVLDASWFQTVGNYCSNGSPQINVLQIITFGSPTTDPYSCNPPQLGCAGRITYTESGTNWNCSAGGTVTLQPGIYGGSCAKQSTPPISLTSGTTTLCPGIYYLNGEDTQGDAFLVKGATVQMGTAGATINGVTCQNNGMNGVTIIASDAGTGTNGGGFQIQSGTVNLSAPTSSIPNGCTPTSPPCIPSGLLFYQDPTHADTNKHGSGLMSDSTIAANGTTSLEGTMYTPKTNLTFTGNSNSTCFITIALTVTYIGNSTMSGNLTACKGNGVTAPVVLDIVLAE